MNTADPKTGAVTSSVGDGLSATEARRLFEIEAIGDDVNPLLGLTGVATIGPRPERSQRMREIFLPRGWVDELRAPLVERGRRWGYLHLFRKTPFTRSEIRIIAGLTSDLAKALRTAPIPNGDGAPPAVMMFGKTTRATASADAWISEIPADSRHGGLPHAIVAVAAAASAGRSVEATIPSRRGLMRVVALPEPDGAVVVLDRASRAQVIDAFLARHRLSPREEDICRAMLSGSTDKEIAKSLEIGLETVKGHCRAAYAKLGVSGRRGLMAKVGI
jgi:DNA-binding CsgD family transcriptional regulator